MTTLQERQTRDAVPDSRGKTVVRLSGIAFAVLAALVPLVDGDGFLLSVGAHTLLNAVMALSLTLVYGMGGLISLAQVGFGTAAAYVVVLGTEGGYPFLLTVVAALAVVVLLALLLGLPVVRLSGIYFLTATFAFTEILRLVALNWTSVTGGEIGTVVSYDGLTQLPGASVFASFLQPELADYLIALLLFATAGAVIWCYRNSRQGRNLMALRDNESLAVALGVRAVRERLGGFVLGAVVAAFGGIYLAHFNGIVDPTSMEVLHSVYLLIIVLVGGIHSIRGALVGAVVVTVVPELLQISVDYRPILYGALLIVFATRLQLGIVGELRKLSRSQWWSKRFHKTRRRYD